MTATTHDRITEIDKELAAAGVPAVADVDAAAKCLSVNFRTIHRLIERGDLAAFKIGNRWRVRRAELARFVTMREA